MFCEAESYAFAWRNQKFTLPSLQHNSFCTVWCSPSLLRVQSFKTLEVLTQELGWWHKVNATKHFCCVNNGSILLSGTCCFVLMLLAWQWHLLSDRVSSKPSFLKAKQTQFFPHVADFQVLWSSLFPFSGCFPACLYVFTPWKVPEDTTALPFHLLCLPPELWVSWSLLF